MIHHLADLGLLTMFDTWLVVKCMRHILLQMWLETSSRYQWIVLMALNTVNDATELMHPCVSMYLGAVFWRRVMWLNGEEILVKRACALAQNRLHLNLAR
jgi:hypothetical protein